LASLLKSKITGVTEVGGVDSYAPFISIAIAAIALYLVVMNNTFPIFQGFCGQTCETSSRNVVA
jgi:hypothetical protein